MPDGTRSCPLPLLLRVAREALAEAREVTVLIALGTHQAMSEQQLARHLGYPAGDAGKTYPGWRILNHESWQAETFTTLGTLPASRIAELTDTAVDVRINRHVAEADVAIAVGPVFPHEVVGFSGGNKYLFPGVSGQEVIDLSHWVGALITSAEMIGTRGVTPVRALINEAASMISAQRLALCLVVSSGTDALHAAAFGTSEDAWAACMDVSAETHIAYHEYPVRRVLSIMPTKYEDIWTAGSPAAPGPQQPSVCWPMPPPSPADRRLRGHEPTHRHQSCAPVGRPPVVRPPRQHATTGTRSDQRLSRHTGRSTASRPQLRLPALRQAPGPRPLGRTHARTHVIVLVQDRDIRIINAATGELLRELVLDPTKHYQGTGRPPGPAHR